MNIEKLYDFRESLSLDGIIFCYSGPVSQELIEEIGDVIKMKLELEDATLGIIQRVFGIFVEQVQNIMNYSAEKTFDKSGDVESRSGVIVVGKTKNDFYILSGNLVENSTKRKLVESFNELSGKAKHELKSLYKERLKQGHLEEGKGAGIGLIDIARKASEPITYCFRKVDSDYSFYSAKVQI